MISREKGTVASLLPQAVVSTVNLAEVVTKLAEAGMPEGMIKTRA
jgi:PIN domain nuclease of toxin-antitoxin system